MTYFFTDIGGLEGFLRCPQALGGAGRKLPLLPPVERGVYAVQNKAASPRVKVGADVLPWWPVRGMYLLLETHEASATDLAEVDGVAGVWSVAALDVGPTAGVARGPASNSPTAFWTTTRSTRRPDSGPFSRSVGHQRASSRCLRRRSIPVIPYEWDRYVP